MARSVSLGSDWPYLLIGAAVLGLTCYRAFTTSVIYDEAETYLRYVEGTGHSDKQALAGFLSVQRANNHPLNTILIDITSAFYRYSEPAMRLPNVLMFGVYVWLAICVSRRFRSRPLVFGLLTLNWFLDEYFGLARGYGLAAGLVLVALALWLEGPEDERGLRRSLWLLLLACLANYAVLPLLMVFCLEAVISRGWRFLARSLCAPSSLAGGALLGWCLYALLAVSAPGKPLTGDLDQAFWEPVVGGYLWMFVPEWSPRRALLVCGGVAFLALLASQWVARWREFQLGRCLVLLFALMTAASHLLGKPTAAGRVLLPFWPLVALSIGATADFHAHWLARRRPAVARPLHVVALLCLAGLVWNFVRQADASSTWERRGDYALVAAIRGPLERGECLKRRYMKHPVTNFYVKKYGRDWMDPALVCPKSPVVISR